MEVVDGSTPTRFGFNGSSDSAGYEARGHWLRITLLFLAWFCCMTAHGEEEKVYRTGLTGKGGPFAVSPDGSYLLFNTGLLAHGLRLLDLENGQISVIPMEPGRYWEMPRWSDDGRQVVAVSTAIKDNYYSVDDMQIILIDPRTWKHRTVSFGEGVKVFPFFSTDGKTVYYFKGKKRERGVTLANRFDLYAIDLASGDEERLTDQEFYQVNRGDDHEKSKTVLFSAYGGRSYRRHKDLLGKEGGDFLFALDLQHAELRLFPMGQSGGIFNFRTPERDRTGNIYFIAAQARSGGGNYLWFVFKATPEGREPVALTELPIGFDFDIAKQTGGIYVMDKQGEEIVFRRLAVRAEH